MVEKNVCVRCCSNVHDGSEAHRGMRITRGHTVEKMWDIYQACPINQGGQLLSEPKNEKAMASSWLPSTCVT